MLSIRTVPPEWGTSIGWKYPDKRRPSVFMQLNQSFSQFFSAEFAENAVSPTPVWRAGVDTAVTSHTVHAPGLGVLFERYSVSPGRSAV